MKVEKLKHKMKFPLNILLKLRGIEEIERYNFDSIEEFKQSEFNGKIYPELLMTPQYAFEKLQLNKKTRSENGREFQFDLSDNGGEIIMYCSRYTNIESLHGFYSKKIYHENKMFQKITNIDEGNLIKVLFEQEIKGNNLILDAKKI